ncbi:histone-lysine N-methyltransferase SETMAR [Plakobranchus ocellatus]|uniref:Histone-lysine N-methyltransferase SETMAR n=1 Tax=Plakobranchus ocellatus TaxID=259542 RepID=A0AAV3ZYC6_9GAST|nr:histone-lysine N-methyltransferase SETMAR [Plakobranchus ocellatus]
MKHKSICEKQAGSRTIGLEIIAGISIGVLVLFGGTIAAISFRPQLYRPPETRSVAKVNSPMSLNKQKWQSLSKWLKTLHLMV